MTKTDKPSDAFELGYFSKMAEAGFTPDEANDVLMRFANDSSEKQAFAPLAKTLGAKAIGGLGKLIRGGGAALRKGGGRLGARAGNQGIIGRAGIRAGQAGRQMQHAGLDLMTSPTPMRAAAGMAGRGALGTARAAGRTAMNPYFLAGTMVPGMMGGGQQQQAQPDMGMQQGGFDPSMLGQGQMQPGMMGQGPMQPQFGPGMQAAMTGPSQ